MAELSKKGKLEEGSVRARFAYTAADGKARQVQCSNLDVIIDHAYALTTQDRYDHGTLNIYYIDSSKGIADNAVVAITLMIA